ncbi:MerR family transcriptional regulator [Scatolibacter rhodanostii]|uniref:MerR family transcriptional regulator n=1 Tax=Scatolibacter rhodanostii TaxID=2014781 RepID=UPI0013565DC0|nr:MerR family transcriptional regulator [Scatolibacter rhodanostii]
MDLIKITQVTDEYEISSRTLRYYEQVGLIESTRPAFEKYRYYDRKNLNRLQQILVLRKMQMSIKDILRIYENEDMQTLVRSFVCKITELDEEIHTLSELKTYINDFLNAMTNHGVVHISALPLLYEKMEFELSATQNKNLSLTKLNELSDKLAKPLNMDIITLPPVIMLTSLCKDSQISDIEGFWNYLSENQIPFGKPGSRTLFECQKDRNILLLQVLSPEQVDDLANCNFVCQPFSGGLFAVESAFVDEDLAALQERMLLGFDGNAKYEVDFLHNGNLRHETLIESIFSPESDRERIQIYIPIRKRKPSFLNYPDFNITEVMKLKEIEHMNPILRSYVVDFHKISPLYNPHFEILKNGDAEFNAWISQRMLDTNVAVRLPFRIDIEFLAEEKSEEYLWGTNEGSLWFSHGNCTYTINSENYADTGQKKHGISFDQPILENHISYSNIGYIPHDTWNRLTWIIGTKHFAVILNDNVRFCAENLAYMQMDLHLLTPQTVLIGSNGQGKKVFRSIRISQLKTYPKITTTQGALSMTIKQSNNMLPNVRQIVHPEYGENYWFNGCASYVMECLGEKDYDYWFFAGLTGDNFTQIYSKNSYHGDSSVDYRLSEDGNHQIIEDIFAKIGYASTFVPLKQITSNRKLYTEMLISSINLGIPVILNDYGNNPHNRLGWGVLVGYADYGKTLLYMGGDATQPDSISIDDLLPKPSNNDTHTHSIGWIFVGEKQTDKPLAEIYRERILSLPELWKQENENYCFGAKAFITWAEDIENGYFEKILPEAFEHWLMHGVYVCCLATNSGGCQSFLEKTLKLNPDMSFIKNIMAQYTQTGQYWNNDNGKDLEAIGGGFNATLDVLQDKDKRNQVANKLRDFSACMDTVTHSILTNKQL